MLNSDAPPVPMVPGSAGARTSFEEGTFVANQVMTICVAIGSMTSCSTRKLPTAIRDDQARRVGLATMRLGESGSARPEQARLAAEQP